jgi:hypothetical protein
MDTLKSIFTDHINSILGAISLHLMIIIAFLSFKLGESDEIRKSQVLIEFNEEISAVEEKAPANEKSQGEYGEDLPVLDKQTLHTIASNVASKLDDEISTQKYEQQVMQELGISTLKSTGGETKQSEQTADENAISQEQQNENSDESFNNDVPNIIRKDNTTVSYFLEGRWHKYLYIPTYKCQGGGTVNLDIIINQEGKVISALIAENKSTHDPCLREEAYKSAISARFNSDTKSNPKQLGTITYVFLAQ